MSGQYCRVRSLKRTLGQMLGTEPVPLFECGKKGLCNPRGHGSVEWCTLCSKTSFDSKPTDK